MYNQIAWKKFLLKMIQKGMPFVPLTYSNQKEGLVFAEAAGVGMGKKCVACSPPISR
jgi:hypothetical protein